MKTLKYYILVIFGFIGSLAMAQSQEELSQLMFERGEYYFTLSIQNPEQIQELCRICSVDGINGQTVVAYANQVEYDRLITLGYQPELQTPP